MDERIYWLGFSTFSGIGPVTFKKLLKHFGSAKTAWNATEKELEKLSIPSNLVKKFVQFRTQLQPKAYAEKLKKLGIKTLLLSDDGYPKLLKEIPNPPFVLYIRGKFEFNSNNSRTVGVVGTRKITEYGRAVTEMFAKELVENGYTIVSGLAMGVDAVSHATAVENNGTTIAVLGCGVDCCTPSSNQSLYNSIVKSHGCVISEYPPGKAPLKGNFPSRNRIIAGLSHALLVTEGAEDSGSLITADYAFKFSRPVFAVPGPITSSLSKGPYSLIKKGATLVTEPEQIIKQFSVSNFKFSNKSKVQKSKKGTKDEQKILELLENESVHFNDLVKRTKLNSSRLGSLLSLMEVKGFVRSTDGGLFSIIS